MDRKPWPANSQVWNAEEVSYLLVESNEMIQLRCNPDLGEQGYDDPPFSESPPFSARVHKKLLCQFSNHYRAIFQLRVPGSGNAEIQLDLPGRLARNFVLWLYSGQLPSDNEELFLPMYVFAHKIGCLALRRCVMTDLVEGAEFMELPAFQLVQDTLAELPITSALRRFLVDKYIHHWIPTVRMFWEYETFKPEAGSTEFLDQVMVEMSEKNEKLMDPGSEVEILTACPCCHRPCNYHEHKDHEEWKATCYNVHLWRENKECPQKIYYEPSDEINAGSNRQGDSSVLKK